MKLEAALKRSGFAGRLVRFHELANDGNGLFSGATACSRGQKRIIWNVAGLSNIAYGHSGTGGESRQGLSKFILALSAHLGASLVLFSVQKRGIVSLI